MSHDIAPIFFKFHQSLRQVHAELREGAAKIERVSRQGFPYRDLVDAIMPFCEELLNHHKSEDAFFFPGIRHAGRLKSSDVAFLDARDAEHKPIHSLCETLLGLGKSIESSRAVTTNHRALIISTVTDLTQISLPHFQEEEITLTPEHMATLLSEQQLSNVYRDMGQNWNRR